MTKKRENYGYANIQKLEEARKGQKRRYYGKTAYLYVRRPWSALELQMVMDHEIPDSELSVIIERSVMAIQVRRNALKKEMGL